MKEYPNRTPISYYGGKQNLTRIILPMIPEHKYYIEPFVGGGSVFWAKPKGKNESINDISGWVTNFYRQMKTNFDALNKMIVGTPHSELEHARAGKILKDESESDLNKAWAFWVQTIMSFGNNMFRGFGFSMDTSVPKAINRRRKEFEQWAGRLDEVEIFCRDAVSVIELKDDPDSFFYIDPPYVSSDQGHYKGYTDGDFVDLLDALLVLKGKFLLSSYPEKSLMEYTKKAGWNQVSMKMQNSMSNKKGALKTEVLTYNYSLRQNEFDFL